MQTTQLLVLAGGFGTRLRSIVSDTPKPLAPINDNPFLYHFIKNWERQGITKFVFLLHYNAGMIIEYVKKNFKSKFSHNTIFEFIVENEPLGTGGAVLNAILKNNIKENFFLSNCDTWVGNSLETIKKISPPAIGVIKSEKNERYGQVEILNGIVLDFKEKTNDKKSSFINAGVYYLSPIHFLNFDKKFFSLEKDFLPILCKEKNLKAVTLTTNFIDIGIPSDYKKFINWIKNNKKGLL